MTTGPKPDRRGGHRPGAGRKPLNAPTLLSAKQLKRLLSVARKQKIARGKSIDDVLVSMCYGEFPGVEKFNASDIVAAVKLFKACTSIQIKEGGEADKELGGPAVYLPEQRPKFTVVGKE